MAALVKISNKNLFPTNPNYSESFQANANQSEPIRKKFSISFAKNHWNIYLSQFDLIQNFNLNDSMSSVSNLHSFFYFLRFSSRRDKVDSHKNYSWITPF